MLQAGDIHGIHAPCSNALYSPVGAQEVDKYTTEGDLRRFNALNIKRLKEIGCYRGRRHINVSRVGARGRGWGLGGGGAQRVGWCSTALDAWLLNVGKRFYCSIRYQQGVVASGVVQSGPWGMGGMVGAWVPPDPSFPSSLPAEPSRAGPAHEK